MEKRIDIAEILKYPLTPVPLSMCHIDGTMASTQKDAIVPPYIDFSVLDGMCFLRTIGEFPDKFGKIAEFILKKNLCDKIKKNRLSI